MPQSIASRLTDYLGACPPFDWAAHNCTHFAAGWLQQVEGAAPNLPAVAGPVPAMRAIWRLGTDLADATTRVLGRQPLPAAQARVGDLVQVPAPQGGQALGICAGRTAALITPAGVAHVDMAAAVQCWAVQA
ncbi:DUF6950 family protein [Pseudaquabacterium pictum]|uniref:DUF6950 domain-containing protein n=1 Tax=Pseudaquabacterium pictum TaxID=2315236 RepID=A0A480AP97_9BURK|nr:hypothetical protein [Rubrivivax pictus]GCL61485.1 hypothetical protein AQPW35_05660 [Rubrivivax pictus]